MPLRTTNDNEAITGALTALSNIIVPNTQVELAEGTVMVNDDGPLQLKQELSTPAVLLLSEAISKVYLGWRKWQIEAFTVQGRLLARTDRDPRRLDEIWLDNYEDAGRMLANVEDNPTLLWQGQSYAVETRHLDILSRDQAPPLTKDYGIPLVQVRFVLVFKLPPYVSQLPSDPTQPV